MTRCFSRRRTAPDRRMIIGALALVMLGLSGALSAAVFALHGKKAEGMEFRPEHPASSLTSVKVLLPIRDINANQALDPSLFREEERPLQYVSPRAVRSVEQIKGQTARTFISAAEPLLTTHITESHAASPLARMLCDSCRAVTIRVNDLSSMNGLIMPGERVDVAWIRSVNGISTLDTIVQAAKVIARDESLSGDWRPGMAIPGTITLEVVTADAQKILLAQVNGVLNLALRPRNASLDPDPGSLTSDWPSRHEPPRKTQHCTGRIRLCNDATQCEWHCIKRDGSFEPLEPESKDDAGRI